MDKPFLMRPLYLDQFFSSFFLLSFLLSLVYGAYMTRRIIKEVHQCVDPEHQTELVS